MDNLYKLWIMIFKLELRTILQSFHLKIIDYLAGKKRNDLTLLLTFPFVQMDNFNCTAHGFLKDCSPRSWQSRRWTYHREMPSHIISTTSLLEGVTAAVSLGTRRGNLHLGAAQVGNNSQASPAVTLWVIANQFQVQLTKYSMSQISHGWADAILRLSTIWTKLEVSCSAKSCAYTWEQSFCHQPQYASASDLPSYLWFFPSFILILYPHPPGSLLQSIL